MNWLKKALKLAFIALTYKDELKHHFDKIIELKGLIEAQKDEIIALYDRMKDSFEE